MGLIGKLVAAIEFKHGGDVFHELFRNKPHEVSTFSPDNIQGCDLHEGEFGHVGSIISWKYTHNGKECISKQMIQSINEEEKLIEFKLMEGELMELYKTFVATMHVETKGDIDLVTCTLDYEMLNEDVEHPTSILALWIDIIKDIETNHTGEA